jgi:hypothetical protein
VVTSIALVAATGVSLVGVVQAVRTPMASGPSFRRDVFHARLAEVDFAELSSGEREELARLLERDVAQGRLWLPEAPTQSSAATRFHRNFDALAAYWARQQAADFARLPADQRKAFVRRRSSALRRLLRAANYLDMRTLTLLAGREPPPAVLDLPRGWVHEELLRWERAAPRAERDVVRQYRQAMEPQAVRRVRQMGED